jgi:hypothetical protein
MITSNQAGESRGFHSVTVTGDQAGRIVTTVDLGGNVDVTTDPQFLGEPPVVTGCACSHCARRVHVLDGVVVGARAFHRFDLSPVGGYYADELEAYQR